MKLKIKKNLLKTIISLILISLISSSDIVNYTSLINNYKDSTKSVAPPIFESHNTNKKKRNTSTSTNKHTSHNHNTHTKTNRIKYSHDSGVGPLVTSYSHETNFVVPNMLTTLGWDTDNVLKKYRITENEKKITHFNALKALNRKFRMNSLLGQIKSASTADEREKLIQKIKNNSEIPEVHHMYYKAKYRMKDATFVLPTSDGGFESNSAKISTVIDASIPLKNNDIKDIIDQKFTPLKILTDVNPDNSTHVIVKGSDKKSYEMKIYFRGNPTNKEFQRTVGNDPTANTYFQGAEKDFKKHQIILNRLYGKPDNNTIKIIKNKGQRGVEYSLYPTREKNPFIEKDNNAKEDQNTNGSKGNKEGKSSKKFRKLHEKHNKSKKKYRHKNNKTNSQTSSSSNSTLNIVEIPKNSKADKPVFDDVDFPECISESTKDAGNYLVASLYEMPTGTSLSKKCYVANLSESNSCISLIPFISKSILNGFTILYQGSSYYPYNNLKANNIYMTYAPTSKYLYLDRLSLSDNTYDDPNNKPIKKDLNDFGNLLISLIIGSEDIIELFKNGKIENGYDLYLKIEKYLKDKKVNVSILNSYLNTSSEGDDGTPKMLFYEGFLEEFEKSVFGFIYKLKNEDVVSNKQFSDISLAKEHHFIKDNTEELYKEKIQIKGGDSSTKEKELHQQVIDMKESNISGTQDY